MVELAGMNQGQNNFTDSLKEEHYGKWLVVTDDYSKILGFSDNLKELTDKFNTEGVIYTKAENPQMAYAL
jgi:hypothetical protein